VHELDQKILNKLYFHEPEKEFLDFMQSKQQNSMYYFFNHLEELPFYSHLESILWNDKKDLKKMLAKREYKSINNWRPYATR
jgi:hypothetical protein